MIYMLLVHLQATEGPIGVWRVRRGELESAYQPRTNPNLIEAARSTLHKGKNQDWSEVFTYAIQRSPYESQYVMSPLGDDNDDLDYLLQKARLLFTHGKLETTTHYDEKTDSNE